MVYYNLLAVALRLRMFSAVSNLLLRASKTHNKTSAISWVFLSKKFCTISNEVNCKSWSSILVFKESGKFVPLGRKWPVFFIRHPVKTVFPLACL